MRRITARLEIGGKEVVMEFLTNNMEWAASSICDLYKSRWGIEEFFKQIKQTLNLGSFLGHSRSAIEWQVWTALLTYLLLRFLHACSKWLHSFTQLASRAVAGEKFARLFAIVWDSTRQLSDAVGGTSGLFTRFLSKSMIRYGTAGGLIRNKETLSRKIIEHNN